MRSSGGTVKREVLCMAEKRSREGRSGGSKYRDNREGNVVVLRSRRFSKGIRARE